MNHSLSCPGVILPVLRTRNTARKVGGAVGTVAGAAGSAAAAFGGAEASRERIDLFLPGT